MLLTQRGKIVIYSKTKCPYCKKAKKLLEDELIPFKVIELDKVKNSEKIKKQLISKTKQSTVPNIFIGEYHVGGYEDLNNILLTGEFDELLEDYDIVESY